MCYRDKVSMGVGILFTEDTLDGHVGILGLILRLKENKWIGTVF
jgi:hypothetical protein